MNKGSSKKKVVTGKKNLHYHSFVYFFLLQGVSAFGGESFCVALLWPVPFHSSEHKTTQSKLCRPAMERTHEDERD